MDRRTSLERSGIAVVTASALSHSLDSHQKPESSLLKLGGQSVICHVVWQLNQADLKKIILVTGFSGGEVKQLVDRMMEEEPGIFHGLEITYIDLGDDFTGGHTASVLAAAASPDVGDSQVLLVGADHIIDADLLRKMKAPLGEDVASVLVETDLGGMVGLPRNTVKVGLRPLDGDGNRINGIGANLGGAYGGIEAGAVCCSKAAFNELAMMRKAWQGDDSVTLATCGAAPLAPTTPHTRSLEPPPHRPPPSPSSSSTTTTTTPSPAGR